MQALRGKTLNHEQDQLGVTVRNKIIFPASIVASVATAFGLGVLSVNNPNAPAGATPLPVPTETVTAAPDVAADDDAQDVADDVAVKTAQAPSSTPTKAKHAKPLTAPEKATQKATEPKHAKPTKAGAAGPFKDAQDDGKHLDDVMKSVLPGVSVGVHIPDQLLPFPGPGYTGKPTTIETQEDADKAAQSSYNADDVVSGPNIITDPDKPWFHFPTEPVAEAPVSSTPVVSTPVEAPTTEPIRTGGLVTGTRPHWG
jgi:hypothetical protein